MMKMNKKKVFLMLFVVVIVSFALNSLIIATMAQTRELRYATHVSEMHKHYYDGLKVFSEWIEEETEGKVKITPYVSETLLKARDTLEGVKSGIADVGQAMMGLFPGRFPVTEVAMLPGISPEATAVQNSQVLMELYNTIPEIQDEWKDFKVLTLYTNDRYFLATQGVPVRQLEDVKNLKLRIGGTYGIKYFNDLGATTISAISPGDIYENMQKKVIDGYGYTFDGFLARGLSEVTDYITDAKWGGIGFFVVMNLDVWNNLPEDIQEAIESVSGMRASTLIAKTFDSEVARGKQKAKDEGIEIISLSPMEKEKWQQAAMPVWDDWVKDVEKEGISKERAEEILAKTIDLFEKYK
jgi:TRAP-type C4-dicarboxylate transport system substrate-binding protein